MINCSSSFFFRGFGTSVMAPPSDDLLLLAEVAEIVIVQPALLGSPLEVEIQRLNARFSLQITRRKRSLRKNRIFEKEVLMIAPPSLIGKQRKRKTRPEKRKTAPVTSSATKKELSAEVNSAIGNLGGTDVKLILEKTLTASDLSKNLGRFSIPQSHVLTDFLDQEECQWLESGGIITVPVVEPCLGVSNLALKRWKMSTRPVYVLTTGWNTLARNKNNGLEVDGPIQIWSFRTDGKVGFAIVKAVFVADSGCSPSCPSGILAQ